MTRISPGAGYRYLTEQVAAGRHDMRAPPGAGPTPYYIDPQARGEAPGWWAGDGARVLGVTGWVSEPQMQWLIGEGRHPTAGYRLGRSWRVYAPQTDEARAEAVERAWAALPDDATVEQRDKAWLDIMTAPERRAVSGYDVTVSPVKSVSILWAFGDERVKGEVMAAHHAGVHAVLDHLQRHGAMTRVGANGVRQIETAGLAAMVFDHRFSRERDPQIHAHIVVSAKVLTLDRDGRPQWLALDGRAFYQATIGARVAYERAVEGELGRRLGVRFATAEGISTREIVGIGAGSLRRYAKRRALIVDEMDRRLTGLGGQRRQVSPRGWRAAAQDATLRTRAHLHGGESTAQAVARWRAEDRAAGLDTAGDVRRLVRGYPVRSEAVVTGRRVLARALRAATDPATITEGDLRRAADRLGVRNDRRQAVVDAAVRAHPPLAVARAIRDLARERAVWGVDHLELAIGRVLDIDPTVDAGADWARVQRLAAHAIATHADGLRVLTPPAPVTFGPSLRRTIDGESTYTRHRSLRLTSLPVLAAEKEVIAHAAHRGATAVLDAVLDRVAADLRLSAEKHKALRFLADDRRVVGVVGPAGAGKTYLQKAVAAAAEQAGVPVLGLTVGQSAADVLAEATGMRTENLAMWLHAQHTPPAGDRAEQWRFAPGQWVVLDEASQVSTLDLVRLLHLLDGVGGKLILAGDPQQVPAIGPGGMFRHLASLGATIELRELHRFTHRWEATASLRLRQADPTVLAEYQGRGRIIGGHRDEVVARMIDAWMGDQAAGLASMMLVGTEADAAAVSVRARARLIAAGLVSTGRQVRLGDDTHAGVGDIVVSRRNDRRLPTSGRRWVANRDRWRVTATTADGAMGVRNLRTGEDTALPAGYAGRHVQLGYASTVDSAQGQSVDVARALVDDAITAQRLYVMLTRGARTNTAYVITDDEPPEGTPPAPETAAVAVLADILRRATPEKSATETSQQLWADADALHTWAPIYDDLLARALTPTYLEIIGRYTAPHIVARLAEDLAMPALVHRLFTLQEAGYDLDPILKRTIQPRELDTADDIAAVLSWRLNRLIGRALADPRTAAAPGLARTYTDRIPDLPAGDITDALHQVARLCDQRTTALADLTATHQPAWAKRLGPVPDDPDERQLWLAQAAIVAAYRDRYQHTGDHAIGGEPPVTTIAQWAAWHRARIALGTATAAGLVRAADRTELARLIADQRAADATAPAYVADNLRAAHLALIQAEEQVQALHTQLAAVTAARESAHAQATAAKPRWWHTPGRWAHIVARRDAQQERATDAAARADALRTALNDAGRVVDAARARVSRLEDRHREWVRWYVDALPTRYRGLAAAAEQKRRLRSRVTVVTDAVRDTAARVHAIDGTRAQPHARPAPERLTDLADAAQQRLTPGEPELED
ncbi:conjugative relaxase-like TrwC/TraI family protein [Catenuloplanes nepalensis]|uniref:Conjugative relaxase-like TrwC/TraI family protein n=1 Tax=Catenuloplanes nepalensis TaxID=587533 RepID=A0ABT9MMC0_9ACTN|nr:MobF family relaxase [Catenuloplanes nepalensis]MDP9792581.1 conjugative relaxase-like TrwC/TraI family protein [Catenuloplanes nepalensis]